VKRRIDPERIRSAYIENRRMADSKRSGSASSYRSGPRWDGGVDAAGRKFKPIWPVLADRLEKAGIFEVEDYVRWVFDEATDPSRIYPNGLACDRLVEEFLRVRGEDLHLGRGDLLRSSLRTQQHVFKSEVETLRRGTMAEGLWTNEQVVKHVLLDATVNLSALFRWLAARRGGYEDVAEVWREAARVQYEKDPEAYRTAWRGMMPKGVGKESTRV
jgi:hypothetical protein